MLDKTQRDIVNENIEICLKNFKKFNDLDRDKQDHILGFIGGIGRTIIGSEYSHLISVIREKYRLMLSDKCQEMFSAGDLDQLEKDLNRYERFDNLFGYFGLLLDMDKSNMTLDDIKFFIDKSCLRKDDIIDMSPDHLKDDVIGYFNSEADKAYEILKTLDVDDKELCLKVTAMIESYKEYGFDSFVEDYDIESLPASSIGFLFEKGWDYGENSLYSRMTQGCRKKLYNEWLTFERFDNCIN